MKKTEETMKKTAQSTGLKLLCHIWENQKGKSWDAINHSMLYALRLGIGSHLNFTAADIAYCEQNFHTCYWLGESGWEYPYGLAVAVENRSFIEAIEEHKDRERLALNFDVILEGRSGRVSSLTNERVVIVLNECGELKRSVRKLTHDCCHELWPPKKKKPKAEKETE